jgi:methylmalonyl-CoA mutase N-terminal domain/subunit
VNRFVETASESASREAKRDARPLFQIDPEIERQQIGRLRELRASRSVTDWHAALERVRETAREGGNLVPPIVVAVEARATIGEIADAMRAIFGEYQDRATV